MERSHLSDLMANVQKMHNDIERSSENDRRRLESQIQLLEHQTFVAFFCFPSLVYGGLTRNYSQDSRQQLNEERQNVRRITLQREVETKELRNAIDNQVCFVDDPIN